MKLSPYIPPNGFTGAGQQTQAAQLVALGMPRMSNGTRPRKRNGAKRAAPKKRAAPAKRAKRNGGRFVKGSAAAKRYMAKIRRMRKR